jgi:diguanylate cyclase (GGDEF)-like protein
MHEPTILIADDSVAIRRIVRDNLAPLGLRTLEASDGDEALFIAQDHEIDLALLDVDMPGLSGFDLLAIMRSDQRLADVPVLFLTARTSINDLVEGLSLGACDYLRKPWEPEELRARVQVALRMKQDRDELVARNRELDRLSGTDPLTGLRNRRGLERDLDRLEVRLRGQTVGVLVIDIDRFKAINDTFGHPSGDTVLQAVADRLQAAVTQRNLLARWGGEEFVVVAEGVTDATAEQLAQRLRKVVGYAPINLPEGNVVEITVSVGVSTGLLGEHPLIDAADYALLEAKNSGRDCVRVAARA